MEPLKPCPICGELPVVFMQYNADGCPKHPVCFMLACPSPRDVCAGQLKTAGYTNVLQAYAEWEEMLP